MLDISYFYEIFRLGLRSGKKKLKKITTIIIRKVIT